VVDLRNRYLNPARHPNSGSEARAGLRLRVRLRLGLRLMGNST
jgi:hypothetical protein